MTEYAIDPEVIELLRCPEAVRYTDRGDDPGRLRVVHGCWLVCDDSGYKYPIKDGIPVMMLDVGAKYKSVSEDDLPVPPPDED